MYPTKELTRTGLFHLVTFVVTMSSLQNMEKDVNASLLKIQRLNSFHLQRPLDRAGAPPLTTVIVDTPVV